MKIVCSKDEFASLVRECYASARDEGCCGCPFSKVCSAGADRCDDTYVMDRIDDICEIEVRHD